MEKIIKKLEGMRVLFFLGAFLFIFLGLGIYFGCQAEILAKNYYYQSIQVDVQVNPDSTFDVKEKQTYNLEGDFGFFYREIELKNLDHISDVQVYDSQENRLNENEYKVSYEGNRLRIQWDFPRRTFDKELKSWTVKYKVHGGLGFFDKWDELYWNAIFEDRIVEVKRAEVLVRLPKEFEKEEIELKLFIGPLGSKIESNNYEILDNKTIRFWGYNIEPYHYLTTVVTWPKGAVVKPFLYQNQIINWIVLLIALAMPGFVFIKMFMVWRKKGKDPKIEKTIMAEYSPPENLPPAIFGVLIDQDVDIKDIIATVIDLAVRGYLRIREQESSFAFLKTKDYTFEKLKDGNGLAPFEQKIMEAIFEKGDMVSSDNLKKEFYKKISEIKSLIHEEVKTTGYFSGNIEEIRKKYSKKSCIILFSTLILLIIWLIAAFLLPIGVIRYFAQILILELGLILSAMIILIFAHYMPALTSKGLEAKWKLLGFKEYLQTAERFRLGAETLETFSKYLPYAQVLGVEKKWANRFADFAYQEQTWYVPSVSVSGGKGGAPASFNSFSSSLSSFSSSITSTFGGGPGGAGSGFGGGGGAGGGGGGGGGGAG